MGFVKFQLDIAKDAGKEAALRLEASFDETICIQDNQRFIFDNIPSVKEIIVLVNNSEEADKIEGTTQNRENAAPGKPGIFFC